MPMELHGKPAARPQGAGSSPATAQAEVVVVSSLLSLHLFLIFE
jgi:hypothetical protein